MVLNAAERLSNRFAFDKDRVTLFFYGEKSCLIQVTYLVCRLIQIVYVMDMDMFTEKKQAAK